MKNKNSTRYKQKFYSLLIFSAVETAPIHNDATALPTCHHVTQKAYKVRRQTTGQHGAEVTHHYRKLLSLHASEQSKWNKETGNCHCAEQSKRQIVFRSMFFLRPNIQRCQCLINKGSNDPVSHRFTIRHLWRNKSKKRERILMKKSNVFFTGLSLIFHSSRTTIWVRFLGLHYDNTTAIFNSANIKSYECV